MGPQHGTMGLCQIKERTMTFLNKDYEQTCINDRIQFDIDTKFRYNAIKRFMRLSEKFAKYIKRLFPDLRKLARNVWHIHRIYKTKLKQYKEEYYHERSKQGIHQSSVSTIDQGRSEEMLRSRVCTELAVSEQACAQTNILGGIGRYNSERTVRRIDGNQQDTKQHSIQLREHVQETDCDGYRTVTVSEVISHSNRGIDELQEEVRAANARSQERIDACDKLLEFLANAKPGAGANSRNFARNFKSISPG